MRINKFALSALLAITPLLQSPAALAFEALRDPAKLWEAKTEDVKRVTTARVILADYELIRKDFPEIRNLSNQEIDQWLLRNTAFVSKEQAAQEVVNDKIHTDETSRMAYRPREYRRAHVFVADTGGLIDAKGTGAVDPSGGSHDNGLATLGDMIREYTYEKLIHALFVKDGRFDTVGSYAVIDYGFDIKHPDGGRSRAGTVLRQAHTRYHDGPMGIRTRGQSTMLPREHQVEVETFLRQFGVTSSVKFNGLDLVNLQGAQNGAVIDFGSFLTQEKFTNTVSFFYDKNGSARPSSADVIMKPGETKFIQPTHDLQIPFKIWGYSQTGKADSKYDNPYIWAHELAESLAKGHASRQDAEQHVRNLFDTAEVQNVFARIHPSCQALF
ncbi:hypothetical protein [Bdellovibrio sp. NC01]|uniref:hypothetical protein n=1 Tax=Bdellovibrio sp. NC01 TaxID=2220073 RepID=UPI00115A5363|nr:hypothetical protein [Bdellovibrio sp. NC01]QDK38438.1 hypothetical protein DOE51_13055 [Bdellovibrio sp. NC01]